LWPKNCTKTCAKPVWPLFFFFKFVFAFTKVLINCDLRVSPCRSFWWAQ
jgi:hypothetical protein